MPLITSISCRHVFSAISAAWLLVPIAPLNAQEQTPHAIELGLPFRDNAILLTADTPWIVPKDQPEAVQRALADVERDWYKVLGHRPIVLQTEPEGWIQPLVRFGISGKPGAPESFSLKVDGKTLAATGADKRGAIYAAYALSEDPESIVRFITIVGSAVLLSHADTAGPEDEDSTRKTESIVRFFTIVGACYLCR